MKSVPIPASYLCLRREIISSLELYNESRFQNIVNLLELNPGFVELTVPAASDLPSLITNLHS